MRIGSLFSGGGGLDRAVEAVFGGHTVWFSEIDKAASKVLAYRWPGVPNLGSITEIDWAAVEPVDVLCGGFPCQDVSAAGRRAGIKDGTRSGLWAVFAEAIDALRPQYVVIENVRGLLSAAAHRAGEDDEQSGDVESGAAVMGNGAGRPFLRAAGAVLGDLADIGYDAVWATVAASDVGAPHRRERVFIVATAADTDDMRSQADQLAIGRQSPLARARTGDLPLPGIDWLRREHAAAVRDGDYFTAEQLQADIDAHSSRYGRDEGRPESAGIVGRPDAAVSGDEPGVALLPTPCAQQSGNTPENHLAKKPGRKVVTDLAILVENGLLESGGALLLTPNADVGRGVRSPDGIAKRIAKGDKQFSLEDAVALLPTPCVVDRLASGEMTLDEWDESRKSQKERGVGSFGPRGDSLGAAILRVEEGTERPDYSTTKARRGDEPGVALLPTPSTHDKTGARSPESIARMDKPFANLNDTVVNELLPTPSLSDVKTPRRGDHLTDTIENNTHTINLADAVEFQHGRDSKHAQWDKYALGLPLFQTPQARDGKGLPGHGFNEGNLLSQVIDAENTCSHPADARLISDSAVSCGVCSCRLSVDDAARSYGTDWGKYAPAIVRWESLTRPSPAPTEPNKNGNPRLSAAFSEWLMGWPDGWVTDPAIGISRNDQLKICGNGVCSQQAAAALRYLLSVCQVGA